MLHRFKQSQVSNVHLFGHFYVVGEVPDSFQMMVSQNFYYRYLAWPMLMGTQRRKLNWTDPPGENGLTMVFSTRPLRIGDPCACEKRGEESTLVFLVVFGRGSEG